MINTRKQKRELRKSLKLHAAGLLTGAAVAIEEDRSVSDVIGYAMTGLFATLFLEGAFPKAANVVKNIL